MGFEEVMALTNRLLTSAQALAAVAARIRLDELEVAGDPAVRAQLDRVLGELGVADDVEALDERERSIVVSFARSYLAQALDLVDDPARGGAWSYSDPTLLRAQGSASAAVARLITEAGLGSPGARILDVGTGVGGLAIAFCTTFPDATVVGIDPWEPALAIARESVASAGLEARVTLLPASIEDFEDPDGFDLVWLPSFFIPEAVLDGAIERVFALTRPGGTVVVGAPYAGEADPVASAVDDLVTVRSGGSILDPADGVARLRRAGFAEAHEIERTWDAPLQLVAARRS
ncbi:MAG TPA: class I SAM-dependent methyltransferase [Gaiellaceae bacterium]|nr:class I SAM-dependent methyltransferase [Gaiellaceae bacterium]